MNDMLMEIVKAFCGAVAIAAFFVPMTIVGCVAAIMIANTVRAIKYANKTARLNSL